jgi:hypothetical protein
MILKYRMGIMATLLSGGVAFSQVPVEFFAGHKKATVDVLFFTFFKTTGGQNSRWLFFNRNRASIDYRQTTTTNLPQYGFTEAISFNDKRLKGFAPVAVVQLNARGVFPKLGVQYAHNTQRLSFFTWVVAETLKDPNIDFFVLARATPKLTEKTDWFVQVELVNTFPTVSSGAFSLIQRLRLGLRHRAFQWGLGGDFTATGRAQLQTTQNAGLFLRYVF